MLKEIYSRKYLQYILGLVFGFLFGFLLQKGRACYYDVILRQLLLEDFTVLKIMLSASVTGMIGVYAMRSAGWV
ncbi:MAG: YeeE/YedE family protein, partial [Candidatus Rifleibacteriota bacterium]